MRQPRVFVGRAFVIPPREVAHGEWRPPPGSSRPDGRSELHRQPDREPAGADRPDANPRWGLDCPPMLAPDNRTDDRAQDHPGGHRDDKQPAYQAATSPAGDDRGEYAERRPRPKPARTPRAAPPRKPRAMQPPRRGPPLHAPGPQLTSSCVPLSRGRATVVPFARRTTMVALSIASRLPGPTSRHPSGAVTRTRTPGARAGVSWAPRAPSGKPSASAKQEQMRFMGHLPPERTVGRSPAGFKSSHL